MTESLISTWRVLNPQPGAGLHLVDTNHPLEFYVGRTDLGRPRLVIRGATKPQMLSLAGVVLVERFEDQGGKWNLSFTLQDGKFEEVFLRLADDMHARSASAPNEKVAADRVSAVVDEWRRLLKPRPMGLLSMEELRGLVGELWLVQSWFSRNRSVSETVEGWLGPLGLPQDFWFAEDGHAEAKAIGPATTRIRISSAEQLDAESLRLLVLLVANTDEKQASAVNLPMLASQVKAALAEEGFDDAPLQERFLRLGVELGEPFYADSWFVVSQVDVYEVSRDFPAIRASELPEGVDRVKYQIVLSDIAPHKISSEKFN